MGWCVWDDSTLSGMVSTNNNEHIHCIDIVMTISNKYSGIQYSMYWTVNHGMVYVGRQYFKWNGKHNDDHMLFQTSTVA
jgi:hypothetical protein